MVRELVLRTAALVSRGIEKIGESTQVSNCWQVSPPALPVVLFCLLVPCALPAAMQAQGAQKGAVQLRPVPREKGYEDATAPGALKLACAKSLPALEEFFAEHDVPFVADLVRHENGGNNCHIFYEPTIRGFHAATENLRVSELFFDVETLNFLTLRSEPFGDALDIAKEIVGKVSRPLQINIGVATNQDWQLYERGLGFHFPNSIHRLRLRNFALEEANPWVQDYLKAGWAGDKEKILVTRRLFEGKSEDGELFRPMLDMLSEERFVRSKLSWEGGDLQFVSNPHNAAQSILFYGDSAKAYWGRSLTYPEYDYVLKLEFGADLTVDFGDLVPHVDYLVAFLARENIALLSQPVTENYDFARAALDILIQRYDPMVPEELKKLDQLFSDRDRVFGSDLDQVRKTIAKAKKSFDSWPQFEDGALANDLGTYLTRNCAQDASQCLVGRGLSRLLRQDLSLARRWVTAALRQRTDAQLNPRLLSVIESQLPGFQIQTQAGIDAAFARLEELGFRVIRVPRVGGDRSLKVPWSGISYANAVLIDNQFFVPEFGLGKPEKQFFEQLQGELPSQYTVVPVYARHMMLFNGGAHCVLAIVRKHSVGGATVPANE